MRRFFSRKSKFLSLSFNSYHLNQDGLAAYLVIIPPQSGGRMVEPQSVLRTVRAEGILNTDEPLIEEALSKRRFNTSILISQGIPPGRGRNSELILTVKDSELVRKGQLLVVKRRPGLGRPGVSVKGEEIPGLLGEDLPLVVGENVRLSEDGLRAYAGIDGIVAWSGKRLCVNEISQEDTTTDGLEPFLEQIREATHDPSLDARLQISKEYDRVYVIITPPRPGGRMFESEDIIRALRSEKIYAQRESIEAALAKREFNTPLLVAQATYPTQGEDARIIYQTKKNCLVRKGQVLAVKQEATPGTPGMALSGRVIPAEDGQDVEFVLGENVRLSEDGLRVYAARDGEFILEGERGYWSESPKPSKNRRL